MTKQEEIRAGLLKIIADESNYATYEETRDQVIEYFHSQGVRLPKDKPPLLSDDKLVPNIWTMLPNDREMNLLRYGAKAQRQADIEHYEN